jgi:hypothetical protein
VLTSDRVTRRIDRPEDEPGVSVSLSRLIRYAALIHLACLSALIASGLIFAMIDLPMIMTLLVVTGVPIWGSVALFLLWAGILARGRRSEQIPPSDPLHDAWLDE